MGALIWVVEEGGELGSTTLLFRTATEKQQNQIRGTEPNPRDVPQHSTSNLEKERPPCGCAWHLRHWGGALVVGCLVTGCQRARVGSWTQWAPRFVYWAQALAACSRLRPPPVRGRPLFWARSELSSQRHRQGPTRESPSSDDTSRQKQRRDNCIHSSRTIVNPLTRYKKCIDVV